MQKRNGQGRDDLCRSRGRSNQCRFHRRNGFATRGSHRATSVARNANHHLYVYRRCPYMDLGQRRLITRVK